MTSMPTLPILVATDDPNGGKSPLLESSATKYGRKVGATAYAATIPDENHSQLAPTSTGTIAAATLVSDKKKRSSDVFEDVAPHRINPSGDATDPTPFEHKPSVLASLVDPKSLQSLEAMGGVDGLLRGLGTDASLGLGSWQHTDSGQRHDLEKGEGGGAGTGGDTPMSRATVGDRRRIYGVNQMSSQTSKGLLLWMWSNLKDTHLVFLSVAAAVELVLGFYFDPGTPREGVLCDDDMDECAAPPIDWVEGVVVMIAVLLIVIVGSFNDWQMEHRFHELSDKENDRGIKVVRDGKEQVIKVKDVMAGDIALFELSELVWAEEKAEEG